MLIGMECSVYKRNEKTEENLLYKGVIVSSPQMDANGDWWVVVRCGKELNSVDVYFIALGE